MSHLTVGILTYNEEQDLPRALASVAFANEIIIVDAGSTDKTITLAEQAGAKVIHNGPTKDYAQAHNRVLEEAQSPWVLFVDADEEVSPELAKTIQQAIKQEGEIKGFLISRRDYFLGRLLRYGNTADAFVRLARKDAGRWQRPIHEVWDIKGKIGALNGYLYHYSHPSIQEFMEKANRYTEIDAQTAYAAGERSGFFSLLIYPLAKFVTVYIGKRGFLDGTHGLIFALLDASYSFLKRAKIWQRHITGKTDD